MSLKAAAERYEIKRMKQKIYISFQTAFLGAYKFDHCFKQANDNTHYFLCDNVFLEIRLICKLYIKKE